MANLENMSDATLAWLLKQDKAERDALLKLPDDQLRRLLKGDKTAVTDEVKGLELPKPRAPLTPGETWAGRARAVGQGLGAVGDEAEAAVRSLFGADYDTTLDNIRRKYAAYKAERPSESALIEIGTGGASAFVPVTNIAKAIPGMPKVINAAAPVVNRLRSFIPGARTATPGFAASTPSVAARMEREAIEAAARRSALSRGAEVSATGGTLGALTGFASGEGGFENRAGDAVTGGVLGSLVGAGAPLVATGGRYVADVARNISGQMPESTIVDKAQDIIRQAMNRANVSARDVYKRALLDRRYGITPTLAHGDPELAALAETAALTPSAGRRNLLETVLKQQTETPGRVKGTVQATVKSPEYYATEDQLIENVKLRAKPYYKKAYEYGEVNDLDINELLQEDEIKKAFIEAQKLNKNLAAGFKTPEEKAEFALKPVFDPILDVQGNLVGANITGVKPDVRTLDFIKRRLDSKIRGLEKSLGADDKAKAASLKPMRNRLRERLKEIIPGYEEALTQFKSDSDIAEALKKGLEDVPDMHFQEVKKLWANSSPAERAALKTGFMQRLIRPMEKTTSSRNVAQNLLGEDWDEKMRTILKPKEYKVLKNALTRESELFAQRSSITGGSATMRRAAAKADFDKAIEGDDIAGAVDILTSPGRLTKYTLDVLGRLSRANASDAVYDRVAKMLATQSPGAIKKVLRDIEARVPKRAAQLKARTARQKTATRGVVLGTVHASPEETTPVPYTPAEFVAPVISEEEPTLAPSPDLQ